MMDTQSNGQKIQDVIGADLFPTVQNIADIKQVLDFMEPNAQPLQQTQIQGLIYLQSLGENKTLHDKNPYENIIKQITDTYKKAVAPVEVYLRTIEELVPKPPKPIILAEKGNVDKKR